MPEPTATATETQAATPPAEQAHPVASPALSAADELAAAFRAADTDAASATPASSDAHPAEKPNPYAGLSREEKRRALEEDAELKEEAEALARKHVQRKEAERSAADQRADDERKQREAIEAADRDLDEELAIAGDPYHERYDEVNKKLTQSALMDKVRQRALRDPIFQQGVKAHIEQLGQQAQVAAVQGAIEQFGDDPDFAKVKPERIAQLRQSPECNTVPKFAKALLRDAGWLPPAEVAKREKAAAEDARTRALGGWEPRDFAPSEGRGAAMPNGAFDTRQDARALLEQAFRQEDARPNGRAS